MYMKTLKYWHLTQEIHAGYFEMFNLFKNF